MQIRIGRQIATLSPHFLYELVGIGRKIRIVEESETASSDVGSERRRSIRKATLIVPKLPLGRVFYCSVSVSGVKNLHVG